MNAGYAGQRHSSMMKYGAPLLVGAALALGASQVKAGETGFTERQTIVNLEKRLPQSNVTTSDGKPVSTGYGGNLMYGADKAAAWVSTFSPLHEQNSALKAFTGVTYTNGVEEIAQKGFPSGVTGTVGNYMSPAASLATLVGVVAGAYSTGSSSNAATTAASTPVCVTAPGGLTICK